MRRWIDASQPVVALESTIITHGMPYPDNLATARAVEQVVRAEGAVPATIAVVAGKFRVGLDAATLEALASRQDVAKASRRDLAALVTRRSWAGTTVAATMALAAHAGIALFATGGIGGVHCGAERSFDISADLPVFTVSPVAVVCAGCKSTLDIRKRETLLCSAIPSWRRSWTGCCTTATSPPSAATATGCAKRRSGPLAKPPVIAA